jgi:hypothetical protein
MIAHTGSAGSPLPASRPCVQSLAPAPAQLTKTPRSTAVPASRRQHKHSVGRGVGTVQGLVCVVIFKRWSNSQLDVELQRRQHDPPPATVTAAASATPDASASASADAISYAANSISAAPAAKEIAATPLDSPSSAVSNPVAWSPVRFQFRHYDALMMRCARHLLATAPQ